MISKSQTRLHNTSSTNKVLVNTFRLLAMTTAFSTACALLGMVINLSFIVAIACSFAALPVLFIINRTANSAAGIVWTFVLTGLLGLGLAPTLEYYLSIENGAGIVLQALAGTSLIFFSLSGYAMASKKDFSAMGGILLTGLIVAIVAAIANLFFQIPSVSLAISSVMVFLMSGFILYDTGRIIQGGETNYVRATVSMYLNIYNLFVHLLHLISAFSGDD